MQVKTLVSGKKVVLLKDLEGNWLLPSLCCFGQLVLVAEMKVRVRVTGRVKDSVRVQVRVRVRARAASGSWCWSRR